MMDTAKAKAKVFWLLAKKTGTLWFAIDPFRQSAVIAYYAIFTLPALLVIIITIAGVAFGAEAIDGKIHGQVSQSMGPETADQVREMLLKTTLKWASYSGPKAGGSVLARAMISFSCSGVSIWQLPRQRRR